MKCARVFLFIMRCFYLLQGVSICRGCFYLLWVFLFVVGVSICCGVFLLIPECLWCCPYRQVGGLVKLVTISGSTICTLFRGHIIVIFLSLCCTNEVTVKHK